MLNQTPSPELPTEPLDEWDWDGLLAEIKRLVPIICRRYGLDLPGQDRVLLYAISEMHRKSLNGFEWKDIPGGQQALLELIIRRRTWYEIRKELRRAEKVKQMGEGGAKSVPADQVYTMKLQELNDELKRMMVDLQVKSKVEPQSLRIFRNYVLRGDTAREVAEAFGVTENNVYVTAHRIQQRLREMAAGGLVRPNLDPTIDAPWEDPGPGVPSPMEERINLMIEHIRKYKGVIIKPSLLYRADERYQALAVRKGVLVGRGSRCGLVLSHKWMSRIHFKVGLSKGSIQIRDEGSKHGVRVNGQALGKGSILLEHGDLVAAGGYQFIVVYPDAFGS